MNTAFRLFASILLLSCIGASQTALASVPDDPTAITPLAAGDTAPAFTVRQADGADFHFDPAQLDKPVIMIFYRGGWCPYCNRHLAELSDVEPQVLELGYDLLFFSADRPGLLHESLKVPDLPYTIYSDARMQASRALGIAFRVDDATVKRYKTMGLDLEAASGETHHELPVPAVFIVDKQGIIRYAHTNPDYKVRLSGAELLEAARAALAN